MAAAGWLRAGTAEKNRCLGLVALTRNGAHLLFIKAVSIADERGRVAFQRMIRKDIDVEARVRTWAGHSPDTRLP
jgi:hypothetical protein